MASRTYKMKIGKRGNALWVRIPAAIVRELKIKPGDEFDIVAIRELSFEVRRVRSSGDAAEKADYSK